MGVAGGSDGSKKNNSRFELCRSFLTSTPSFIQIGSKLAKFEIWGGLGGQKVRGLGWLDQKRIKKVNMDLSFTVHP